MVTGTATAAILAVGFVTVLGEAAFSVAALLLVLTAPALWWCARPRERGRGEPSAAVTATPPPDGQVPLSLSTPQLCELWSLTFDRLYKAGRADTLRIVALRQGYLDELDRRNPVGFAEWLPTRPPLVRREGPRLLPQLQQHHHRHLHAAFMTWHSRGRLHYPR
jgi:hypothetical protein